MFEINGQTASPAQIEAMAKLIGHLEDFELTDASIDLLERCCLQQQDFVPLKAFRAIKKAEGTAEEKKALLEQARSVHPRTANVAATLEGATDIDFKVIEGLIEAPASHLFFLRLGRAVKPLEPDARKEVLAFAIKSIQESRAARQADTVEPGESAAPPAGFDGSTPEFDPAAA